MPSDESSTLPRKQHSAIWLLGGLFLVLAFIFLFQVLRPSPPIIVSRETTYVTEPRRADGLPDYEKYVLQLYRGDATPDNNAAVPLLQSLFPGGFDPMDVKAIVTELRMTEAPSASDALEPVHCEANQAALWRWLAGRWLNQRNLSDVDAWAERMIDQSVWRPWTSDQMPPLEKWLVKNKKALDLVVEASRRPRYFMPSPTLINNKRDLLINMVFPKGQSLYHACRSLLARAMWHLGEGRPLDAWQDLHALHRLSGLLSQGVMPVEQSKARDINAMACYATATLLDHGKLTVDQASIIHNDLIRLRPLSGVIRSIDQRDRLFSLDVFVYVGSGGDAEQLDHLVEEIGMIVGSLERTSIDWNIVLRETNQWYDRLATAARLADRAARINAMTAIERDLARLAGRDRTPSDLVAGSLTRYERSRLFANVILSSLLSSYKREITAEDRANTKLELTRLAAALAIYRAEHGRYPEKLDGLVPGILKELPRDLFRAKPFIYQPDADGYLLYSTGENGVDDAGRNAQTYFLESPPFDERGRLGRNPAEPEPGILMGGDDISIHVPHPPFKLPKVGLPLGPP